MFTAKQFEIICKAVTNKKTGLFDLAKVAMLPDDTKLNVIDVLVVYDMPILNEFIPEDYDFTWIHSMGYLYFSSGKQSGFDFVHKIGHKIIQDERINRMTVQELLDYLHDVIAKDNDIRQYNIYTSAEYDYLLSDLAIQINDVEKRIVILA